MSVGIKQVAETAGVSTATVSTVLNRPDRVAAAARAKVLRVIEELGYLPNAGCGSCCWTTSPTYRTCAASRWTTWWARSGRSRTCPAGGTGS